MLKIISIAMLLALPTVALAQAKKEEKKVEVTAPAAATTATDKKEDEADQVITNRRLRADAGSLSKWSAAMYFNYQGGSLANPTQPERPNIVNGQDALTLQNLTGEVGVRYRLSPLDSLRASTGFFVTTPFHDEIDTNNAALKKNFDKNSQELTIADPFIQYTHVDKIWNLQSVSSLRPTFITNNQQTQAGFRSSFYAAQTFMKDIGQSGFSVGGAFQGTWYTFQNDNMNITQNVGGFYPSAEYVINDTFNLRTVFGFQVYEQLRKQDKWTWTKRKVYESVGLGISITRDIFLYPNIQFIPSDIRLDRTNMALSANINLF